MKTERKGSSSKAIPLTSVRHGGGSDMAWACIVANGTGSNGVRR